MPSGAKMRDKIFLHAPLLSGLVSHNSFMRNAF
jgi:hypothetical protein